MPSWPTITDGATVLANALFTSIKAYIDGLTTLVFSNTGLKIRDTNDTHDLTIAAGSDLTANRTLTLTTGDANRTLTISGASTIDQNVSTTGSPTHAALTVTGASTLATITGTTLDLTGVATLAAVGATTGTFSSTLGVTGASTLAALSATTGAFSSTVTGGTYNSQTISNAASLTGTLAVAGAATLSSTLGVTGVSTFAAGSAAAPALTTTGDTNTGLFFPAADTIGFAEGGAEAMRINSSGNVGIGISSPTGKLEIATSSGNGFRFTESGTPGGYYAIQSLDGGGYKLNQNSGVRDIQFQIAGTSAITIDTSRNVGIGTTSPSSTLHVVGTATVDALALSTALAAASGGTGLTAVGTSGNVLTSNGSEWVSTAPSVTSSGAIAASVASNILTLSLTTTDGSTPSAGSPVTLTFRHVTPATGSLSTVSVTAATTVAIPNTATLGTSNSVAFRVWVVAFNDGGTVRLGAINCANSTSIYPLAGWGIASSTAVSTGSDSAQVFYTGTSVSAKAYTVLGYVSYDAGLATAGTWSSAPTQAQPLRPDTRLPGSAVQVVYATYATEVSSTTATYADTGLTATITPTSTPNRMLISAVQTGLRKNNNTYGRLRLQRGATTLADLELQYGFTNTTVENTVGASAIHYVDVPASVAATTYKTTFASATGTATVSLQMSGSMSTIVVQELMV